MIILTLVHAQTSGNENLMNHYVRKWSSLRYSTILSFSTKYDLLSKWGDYLVDNTFFPQEGVFTKQKIIVIIHNLIKPYIQCLL